MRPLLVTAFLLIFALCALSPAHHAWAEGILVPSFGAANSKVKVRLYTDYFCPSCRDLESRLAPVIKDLVKRNAAQVMFVDAPGHKNSSLYARSFLYVLNEKKDLARALTARAVLMEASGKGVADQGKLESLLKEKGIALKPFDTGATFNVFVSYLKRDQIRETPTCVIENDGKLQKVLGSEDIIEALKRLQ